MTMVPDNQSETTESKTELIIANSKNMDIEEAIFGGGITAISAFVACFVAVNVHLILLSGTASASVVLLLSGLTAGSLVLGVDGLYLMGNYLFSLKQRRKLAQSKKNSEAIVINTPKPDTLVKEVSKENVPILPVNLFSKD